MEAEVEDAVNKLAKNDSFPAVPSPSIPLREDQITNAVAFLSHTKVGSSTGSKVLAAVYSPIELGSPCSGPARLTGYSDVVLTPEPRQSACACPAGSV